MPLPAVFFVKLTVEVAGVTTDYDKALTVAEEGSGPSVKIIVNLKCVSIFMTAFIFDIGRVKIYQCIVCGGIALNYKDVLQYPTEKDDIIFVVVFWQLSVSSTCYH